LILLLSGLNLEQKWPKLNENLLLDYYDNVLGPDDLKLGLFEDTRPPIVISISTPSAPSSYGLESITTYIILDLEMEDAWELIKIQLTLQQKAWVLHSRFFFSPLAFFHSQ